MNLQRILESKRAHRLHLASRPVGEKLRLLDALRERELAIRGRSGKREKEEGGRQKEEGRWRK